MRRQGPGCKWPAANPGRPRPPRGPGGGGPPLEVYLPLVYAPALPLLRVALTRAQVSAPRRDAVFGAAVLFALGHAGVVMSRDSTV